MLQCTWKISRYGFWPVWWDTGTPAAPEDWHISGCWSRTEVASFCCVKNSKTNLLFVLYYRLMSIIWMWEIFKDTYTVDIMLILSGSLTPEVFQLDHRTAPCCPWGRSLSWGHPETRLHGEECKSFRTKVDIRSNYNDACWSAPLYQQIFQSILN